MRSYNQYCGVAKALDLVGQRWALLLVREMLPGPRRFSDLQLPGLTPNVLSDRLKQLEASGLIARVTLPPPGLRHAWALTDSGRRLEPVVLALGAFGAAHLGPPGEETKRVRWLLFSLQRRWEGALTARVQVWSGMEPYRLDFADGRVRLLDGEWEQPALTLRGPLPALAALFVGGDLGAPLEVAGDSGLLPGIVEGLGPNVHPS